MLNIILGPLSIIPIMIILVPVFGSYSGYEIGHLQKIPLILQGSSDWGGSNMFAVSVAAYFIFGFLACIYLNLKLWMLESGKISFLKSLSILKIHFYFFILHGLPTLKTSYPPNDERNIFLFCMMVYLITIFFITILNKKQIFSAFVRLIISPLFIYIWLLLGWTGITSKAGQVLNAGVIPEYRPLNCCHALMLKWHYFCDTYLIFPDSNFFPLISIYLGLFGVLILIYYLLKLIRQFIKNKLHDSIYKYYWNVLIMLLISVFFIVSSVKYYQFENIKISAVKIADCLKGKVSTEDIKLLRTESLRQSKSENFYETPNTLTPSFYAVIDTLLKSIAPINGFDIVLLIPLDNEFFLFVHENSVFRYADVRSIKEKNTQIINYDIIKNMIDSKKEYIPEFLSIQISKPLQIFSQHVFCGKMILDNNSSLSVLILVSHDMPGKKHFLKKRTI